MAPHLVYILKKIINRMGAIQFTFSNENINRMTPHSVYILEKNCKPDGGPPIHIFIWKCELDGPPSGL